MDIGLVVTFTGVVVAGLAGVLGVWMEREPKAPPRWAFVFSGLILIAVGIEMSHAVVAAAEEGETEDAMARVLEQLSDLAAKGGNPALEQFVGAELAAQARNNPRVMKKLEKKVAAKGGDPNALRKRAAEGRRSAAGLPARAPGKAGKAGAARPEGAPTRDGKATGKAPTGDGAAPEGGAKAKAGKAGAVDPSAPEVPAGLVPAVPTPAKAGKSGEGKAGKGQ